MGDALQNAYAAVGSPCVTGLLSLRLTVGEDGSVKKIERLADTLVVDPQELDAGDDPEEARSGVLTAIVGFDLVFRTEFTMEYPSDPKRLIETLQRQMPRAELDYIDEEPIRSIVAYDVKGLFVYCDLDSYDFAFISEDEGRGNALDSIMLSDTRLKLLRDKRLALKED